MKVEKDVLEAAGGKWNKKAKAHVFDGDAADRLEQVILTGDVVLPKDDFEFFPTPPAVAERLLELADIRPSMTVLEPSAGKGAIALPAAALGALVDCCELMPTNFNFLRDEPSLGSVRHGDFLQMPVQPTYDRVLMNPPFSRKADIKHVLHALQFLKSGGLLVSVMAAGVLFRQDKATAEFREMVVHERGGWFEELPEGSFKSSGTGVNTVLAFIPATIDF